MNGPGRARTCGRRSTGSASKLVTVVPDAVHADGLWGGTDERVERGIARVQGMLGHEAVVRPVLQGGRAPRDRQALVPWGERPRASGRRVRRGRAASATRAGARARHPWAARWSARPATPSTSTSGAG